MANSLLEQAMQADILNMAWKKLRKEHTPWSINVSRKEMDRNLAKYLFECRDEVLSGRYRVLPLRQYAMAKANGGQRIISAYYLKDKLIQKALLIKLQPKVERFL